MEQRGILLSGIARVLNAGGSALLNVYDAATSIKTLVAPGEKGSLRAQLGEYEKKLERLYCEIGKEVVLRADSASLSAAGEDGIKVAAGYQMEMEKIRLQMQKIEAEEKAAAAAAKREAAPERAAARVKKTPAAPAAPTAAAEESAGTEPPADSPVAVEETPDTPAEMAEFAETEAAAESAEIIAAVDETAAPEIVADTAEFAEPEAATEPADSTPGESADIPVEAIATPEREEDTAGPEATTAETEQDAAPVDLELLLKSDLLQICSEKGIEADKKMTKAELIELISGRA
jgi:hypothetical protein